MIIIIISVADVSIILGLIIIIINNKIILKKNN